MSKEERFEKEYQDRGGISKDAVIVIFSIILVAVVVILLGFAFWTSNFVRNCKNVQKNYLVSVPYSMSKSYDYQHNESLDYEILSAYSSGGFDGSNYVEFGYVYIQNLDYQQGNFTVNCLFASSFGNHTDSKILNLLPGDKGLAVCEVGINPNENIGFSYTIIPETKLVTETRYQNENSYKTESRYETVQECD